MKERHNEHLDVPILGIGSVPFIDPDEAVDFAKEFSIPFIPEIEEMKEYIQNPGYLICL